MASRQKGPYKSVQTKQILLACASTWLFSWSSSIADFISWHIPHSQWEFVFYLLVYHPFIDGYALNKIKNNTCRVVYLVLLSVFVKHKLICSLCCGFPYSTVDTHHAMTSNSSQSFMEWCHGTFIRHTWFIPCHSLQKCTLAHCGTVITLLAKPILVQFCGIVFQN